MLSQRDQIRSILSRLREAPGRRNRLPEELGQLSEEALRELLGAIRWLDEERDEAERKIRRFRRGQ